MYNVSYKNLFPSLLHNNKYLDSSFLKKNLSLWLLSLFCLVPVMGTELTILSSDTWQDFVPSGKEVEAMLGDIVLRNQAIVVVIGDPLPNPENDPARRFKYQGHVFDLTRREQMNDQLMMYSPGWGQYELTRIVAEGDVKMILKDGKEITDDYLELKVISSIPEQHLSNLKALRARVITIECAEKNEKPKLGTLVYQLKDRQPFLAISNRFETNHKSFMDIIRAGVYNRTSFDFVKNGKADYFWCHDKWWGQAYGILDKEFHKLQVTKSRIDIRQVKYSSAKISGVKTFTRYFFPANDLIALKALALAIQDPEAPLYAYELVVQDHDGKGISEADIELYQDEAFYGNARTDASGRLILRIPCGKYRLKVQTIATTEDSLDFVVKPNANPDPARHMPLKIEMPTLPSVTANITDSNANPIPCKVVFIGVGDTKNPFFFPDHGEHAVHNVYYTHNGQFTQILPAGIYDALIIHGFEYDMAKKRIVLKPGRQTKLEATLKRVVDTKGWISADFHSHSTESDDTIASQRGRVLNLLCEHIEFAPCTEHHNLNTYTPHLKALGVEHLMATCVGLEMTGWPKQLNHQIAFPLALKLYTENNGAPRPIDKDPEAQIKRLAEWDNNAEKLVQINHPTIPVMFYDRNLDGKRDQGLHGMFAFANVMEVHPIEIILRATDEAKPVFRERSVFQWLYLLNQGYRFPGVSNTDAHYNYHGSGPKRNYIKCSTDDPARIDPMEIVRESKKGHIVMTTGPFLEVDLLDPVASQESGKARHAIPGDEIRLESNRAMLNVRVQCPNWFDVDRVQILINGRQIKKLNWTKASHPEDFQQSTVRFEKDIPLLFDSDAHVIVATIGEKSKLGPVMGAKNGYKPPAAVSNPIFVDVDGDGFKPNRDTLNYDMDQALIDIKKKIKKKKR